MLLYMGVFSKVTAEVNIIGNGRFCIEFVKWLTVLVFGFSEFCNNKNYFLLSSLFS